MRKPRYRRVRFTESECAALTALVDHRLVSNQRLLDRLLAVGEDTSNAIFSLQRWERIRNKLNEGELTT